MAWLYVPELEDLSLDSESSGPASEPFVMLSGKATQRPLSWRGWASRPWIKLLSGTISAPSTASRGVIAFLASLGVSRASHSVWPESVEDSQTNAGLATICSGWSMKFDPESSCWKTSQVSLWPEDSTASSEDWKILSRAGGVANGCAYPRAVWVPLTEGKDSSDFSWPTPTAGLGSGGNHARANNPSDRTLTEEAKKWPTQTSRDWKDTITGGPPPSRLKLSEQTLGQSVSVMTGPQGLPTVTGGESGSTQEGRRQRLNPAFVEALMGLPAGWSLPTIGCGASETQLWLSRQRRRLASLLGG
jgi:hypothetical protein